MTLETVFLIANGGVLPFWALLLFAPRHAWTERLVHSPAPLVVLLPVYVWALLSGDPVDGASFFSLSGVSALFTSAHGVLAGWVHYLVFDLFIGAWESRDAERNGISRKWVSACLVLTLLVGPVGLAFYLAARGLHTRRWSIVEG